MIKSKISRDPREFPGFKQHFSLFPGNSKPGKFERHKNNINENFTAIKTSGFVNVV